MSGCLDDVAAALVDGELDHPARERAQRHLAHCDACRVQVDGQRRLKAQLLRLDPPAPSDALTARLLALGAPPVTTAPVRRPAVVRPAAVSPAALTPAATGPAVPSRAAQRPAAPGPAAARPAAEAVPTATSVRVRTVAPVDPFTPAAGASTGRTPLGGRTDASRPSSRRPAARPVGAALRSRAPRGLRRGAAAGSAFAVLGAAAALVLGAPQQQPGSTPLDPASDAFVAEFATTTGGSTLGPGTTSPLESASLTSTASVTTFVPVLGRASLSIGGERSTR